MKSVSVSRSIRLGNQIRGIKRRGVRIPRRTKVSINVRNEKSLVFAVCIGRSDMELVFRLPYPPGMELNLRDLYQSQALRQITAKESPLGYAMSCILAQNAQLSVRRDGRDQLAFHLDIGLCEGFARFTVAQKHFPDLLLT
jgi:hypothetical protein